MAAVDCSHVGSFGSLSNTLNTLEVLLLFLAFPVAQDMLNMMAVLSHILVETQVGSSFELGAQILELPLFVC